MPYHKYRLFGCASVPICAECCLTVEEPMTKHLLLIAACACSFVVAPAITLRAQTIGSGTSGGEFFNPSPACPPASCSGLGTNSIFFGNPDPGNPPNGLAFTGRGFSVPVGVPCVLGLLQFQNSSTTNTIDTVVANNDIAQGRAVLNAERGLLAFALATITQGRCGVERPAATIVSATGYTDRGRH